MVSSSLARLGAKPPSSPTAVVSPSDFSRACSAWKTSVACRSPSRNVGAPTGMIMNSCVSTEFVACAPPLRIFIIGTGR